MPLVNYRAFLERRAAALRQPLGLAPTAALDPFALARKLGVAVISIHEVPGLLPADIHYLTSIDPNCWSAGTLVCPDGRAVVVLNPTHNTQRTHATMMEELAHLRLGHRPSQLTRTNGGVAFRSFSKTQEAEAYRVGAAALLPQSALLASRKRGFSRAEVAVLYGVSVELVILRENFSGVKLPSVEPL